jgi:hypothetical protein
LGAEVLDFFRKGHVGVDVALREQAPRLRGRRRDEVDIVARIQADIGRHAGEEGVAACSQLRDADMLAFEVTDRADVVGCEELVAPHMNARERDDGSSGIDLNDGIPDEAYGQIDLARRQRLVGLDAPQLNVVHLGEPFALQEGFGHIVGRITDGR